MIKVINNQNLFKNHFYLESTEKSFSYHKADAIVSAANSFGFMDGGSDIAIIEILGQSIAREVRQTIIEDHYGELAVGSAITIEINHPQYKYLIVAPTMRIPKSIVNTHNVYVAMRAILAEINKHDIESAVMPMLGTGYGQMSYENAGNQMLMAVESMLPRSMSFDDVHQSERRLNETTYAV